MRPIRLGVVAGALAGVLAAGLLSACQTQPTPSAATGDRGHFRERNGWLVERVAATKDRPFHCRGSRPADAGFTIVFLGGEEESGFDLAKFAGRTPPSGREEVFAEFDDDARTNFNAAVRAGGILAVRFPTHAYETILHPLARAGTVTMRGKRMGVLGAIDLDGSSWAINATDECRRMHAPVPVS